MEPRFPVGRASLGHLLGLTMLRALTTVTPGYRVGGMSPAGKRLNPSDSGQNRRNRKEEMS